MELFRCLPLLAWVDHFWATSTEVGLSNTNFARFWRQCQMLPLLREGAARGTKILMLAKKRRDSWARLDTICALGRAGYLHSRLYSTRTKELAKHAGLAATMRRGRLGRPPGRWDGLSVAARGENRLGTCKDPAKSIDVMTWRRGPKPPGEEPV